MPRERLNDVDINYEVVGAGCPVLMLHGFTGSIAAWQGIPQKLSREFRVIVVDMIGHGESSAPADPARYSIPGAVDDLQALLDRLNVEQTAVLGYSMGGRVASEMALSAPERVSSLVLESSGVGIDDQDERAHRAASDEALARLIEEQGIEAFVDRWEAVPLFASQCQLPERVRRQQRELRMAQKPVGLANSLRGMGAGMMEPVSDRLHQFTMPVLYLAGEYDEKYREIGEVICARMPDASYVEIPRAGHTIHLEQPESYLEAVISFLRQIENE